MGHLGMACKHHGVCVVQSCDSLRPRRSPWESGREMGTEEGESTGVGNTANIPGGNIPQGEVLLHLGGGVLSELHANI